MSGQMHRLGESCVLTAYSTLLGGSEYDPSEDVSSCADDPLSSPPQTYPGCFGLPYQDHNYGAPPPLTQTPPPLSPPKENFDIKEEIVVTSDVSNPTATSMPPNPAVEEEIDDPTRCICDFIHDDGYMIQCDKCSVWQHIVCMGLDRDSIPDTYFCEQCDPRPVDRVRAREFQIRKREFLKTLVITSHDSSATDTDPEEVNNRLRAYGLDSSSVKQEKPKKKVKVKKKKERAYARNNKKLKTKDIKPEKENTNKELNKKHRLMVKDFATKTAQAKKEKLTKKIEMMRAERISKEMRDDKMGCEDIKNDERIINTMKTVTTPITQDENALDPWDIQTFNEWEQSYEVAKYNQYTTYVQEYLNSTYINGHHNEIADLVTDGLRVQRCHIKELKNKKKGLESSCNIPNGQPVIEVIGKVMTRHQYDKDNFGQRQLSPFVFFYGKVFELDLVIDASDYGNDARFIRRSCQPNAEVRHVVAGGQAHFITVATKDIMEHTEITIPYDYDYKKWNFCVECACLRNSCPISRYQKRRLRFHKLQIGDTNRKNNKNKKSFSVNVKSPEQSPSKSTVKSLIKTPEKVENASDPRTSTGTIYIDQQTVSPVKMVRRSQVSRQSSVDVQNSAGTVKSLQGPPHKEDSAVMESFTTPEPTTLHCSEVDSVTSPEIKDNSIRKQQENGEQEKKKLTREERKMEAIMRAFEKMEKRNARKASVDQQSKVKEKEKVKEKDKGKEADEMKVDRDIKKEIKIEKDVKKEIKIEKDIEKEPEPEVKTTEIEEVKEERVIVPEVVVQEQPKVEAEIEENNVPEVKEVEKTKVTEVEKTKVTEVEKTKVTEVENTVVPDSPQLREKTVKGKKSKKTTARRWVMSYTSKKRRTRNYSGASGPELNQTTSSEESSVSSVPPTPAPSVSCPVTPCEGPATPPSFRFVKTKRHLMNEWYSEKLSDTKQCKSEPLEVAVGDESLFVTCLPSPHNSMDKLRRNSQSSGTRERLNVVNDNSGGSAKKRWLRQAMGEGSTDNLMSSPLLVGSGTSGTSPNPQAGMLSPGASPPLDFVTPLKKRRLARESLSVESLTNESPTPTPTPSSELSAPGNYFGTINKTLETDTEDIGMKNNVSPFFPVVKEEEELENEAGLESSTTCAEPEVQETDDDDDQVMSSEPYVSVDSPTTEFGKEKERNCFEMTSTSAATNTGIAVSPDGDDIEISNSGLVLQSTENNYQTVHCEQNKSVCDDECKSAIKSEPDSSEGICAKTDAVMELECDSLLTETETPSTAGAIESEVDSTECSVSKSVLSSTNTSTYSSADTLNSQVSVVEPCDSCSSAGKVTPSTSEQRPNLTLHDKACSSTAEIRAQATCNSTLFSTEKNSLVDSSTDQTSLRKISFSKFDGSLQSPVVQGSIVDASDSMDSEHHSVIENKSEVTKSSEEAASLCHLTSHNFIRSLSLNDSFSSNITSVEPSSYPNRHLKFLNDNSYSAEMTADSTTQFLTSASSAVNYLQNNSGISNTLSYDSDSMDVSSASDAGNNGLMEDRRMDDSLNFFDSAASNCESSQPPKEKKKVSLQEYLKRKKDKPVTPVVQTSLVSKPSSVSSTVTTPSKLTTPAAVLEKLQPLPSLPSLPMFEKPERKEFKSSSDLLSPIFNRKEKTEEVRKPMSLSERLRQEFGVDDDIDAELNTDTKTDNGEVHGNTDIPPPPPPPPPQNSSIRIGQAKAGSVQNGNSVTPFMSLKTFHSQALPKPIQNSKNSTGSSMMNNSVPQMVPPPCSTPVKVQPISNKLSITSPLPAQLGNLLTSMKSPAQLKNDLSASLAALKAQISMVQQQALPISMSPSSSSCGPLGSNEQASSTTQPTGNGKVQVFDYGHQSSVNFSRQNSYPSSSSSSFQTYNKASSSFGFSKKASPGCKKVSPRYSKVSSPTGSQSYNSQTFNNHYKNRSPPVRSQKHTSSQKHSSSVSSTSRSHQYS